MTHPTLRGRTDAARPRRTPMAAAERAAAKRADRSSRPDPSAVGATAPEAAPSGESVLTLDPHDSPEPQEVAPQDEAQPAGATALRRRFALLPMSLAISLVAALIAVTVLGLQYHDAERTDKARVAALAAARTAAPVIFSYDYRHLDADFAAASHYLTGSFRDQYAKTTGTVVKPTAAQYQGVVRATVAEPQNGGDPAASVVSASPDKVVVLLFVNQVTTSTRVTGPHLDLNRVRMTLVHTSQGWKVSAVDAL